ncbi:EamA family transporter [Pseudomonas aeruginosa]|nr:EamA family transporter [Pseudomonas aeruginosa]
MRKSADAFAFQTMLLLCVIWGIQQVTIKWAATDIAPVMQAAIRSGIAAALVGLLMCWRGGWEGLRQGTLGAGLLTGTLFALEFLFIALGLQYTTASHMSVFLYTAPIFSALGLHFLLPSERLRPLQWLGVAVSNPGVPIADEHRRHLFERFYRVDAARSNSEANHGLGLSIVKAVASMHGGSVFVDSADGWNTFGFTVLSPERRGSGDRLPLGEGDPALS